MHRAVAFALLLLSFCVGDIGGGVDDRRHGVRIAVAIAVYRWRHPPCANQCPAMASCVAAPQSIRLQNNRKINLLLAELTTASRSVFLFFFQLCMPPPHLFFFRADM